MDNFDNTNSKYDWFLGYFNINHPLFTTMKNVAYFRVCQKCGIYNVKLYACNACHSVYYCSKKHQKKHWKSLHQYQCALLKFKRIQKQIVT